MSSRVPNKASRRREVASIDKSSNNPHQRGGALTAAFFTNIRPIAPVIAIDKGSELILKLLSARLFRITHEFEVSRVEALPEREVRIALPEPSATFLPLSRSISQVSKPVGHLFDPKLMQEVSRAAPFRLASRDGRRSMDIIRNDSCHDTRSKRSQQLLANPGTLLAGCRHRTLKRHHHLAP